MVGDYERRVSTVEANYSTLASSMTRMEGYLGQLFNQQNDIKTSIALVVQNQSGMKEYQVKCDGERGDHEKRITAAESFQKRLTTYAAILTAAGSLASPQLAKLWGRLFS